MNYIVVSGTISGRLPVAGKKDTLTFSATIVNDTMMMSTVLTPLVQ